MLAQTLLVRKDLPFKIHHCVLAATSAFVPFPLIAVSTQSILICSAHKYSKAAHSDLLSAIPSPTAPIKTLQDKINLITPFVYIGFDPAFCSDPKNKPLLDQRVLESVSTRRPSRAMGKQLAVIAGYDVRPELNSVPPSLPVLLIHGTLDRAYPYLVSSLSHHSQMLIMSSHFNCIPPGSVFYSEKKYIERGIPHATTAVLPRDNIGHMWCVVLILASSFAAFD